MDAGCGTGRLCKLLLESGGDVWVYGVDCSLPMLKQAMRKCNSQKAVFMPLSLDEALPFPDNFFDGIFCIHVLYALKNPVFTLKEFYRTLKDGGAVIIVNPISGATLRQHANMELIRKDGLKILRDMPFHIIMALINLIITTKSKNKTFHAYNEEEMEKILKQTGFKNINIHRVYDGTSLLTVAVKHTTKSISSFSRC